VTLQPGAVPAPRENRRLADALFPQPPGTEPPPPPPEETEVDATLTWNDRELLRKADFDTMTADEWRQAQKLLIKLNVRLQRLRTRRTQRAPRGRPDWRATMQQMARHGGELWDMRFRTPGTRRRPWWCWPTSRAR
jgi:uncharacterized protein